LDSGAMTALEGYALWKQGKGDETLQRFQEAYPLALGGETRPLRWWLGKILLELGRPREAERYFHSFWNAYWANPLARYYLGQIHEELGEFEKAREDYEYFVEAWREADPELQPMVAEARAAAVRLTDIRRE